MKVNDQGFTERIATPVSPVVGTGSAANSRSFATAPETGAGDDLQLSGFAARLNGPVGAEASVRADRVGQIAKAINTGTFRVDTAAVSRSIVSEGLQRAS
jgi:anti-sigma28 factor (negative regulator of flagellin synthesis)